MGLCPGHSKGNLTGARGLGGREGGREGVHVTEIVLNSSANYRNRAPPFIPSKFATSEHGQL